jgi:hypothetical protein
MSAAPKIKAAGFTSPLTISSRARTALALSISAMICVVLFACRRRFPTRPIVPESVFLRCQRNIEVRKLDLTASWAIRELKICMRSFENFPPAARRSVEHLKAS